jgi:hypothetical protein
MDDDGLPIYPVGRDPEELEEPRQAALFPSLQTIGVVLDVAWDNNTEKPWIVRYAVELEGKEVGHISARPGHKSRVKLLPLGIVMDEPHDEFEEEINAELDVDIFDDEIPEDEIPEDEIPKIESFESDESDGDGSIEAVEEYVVPKFGRALEGLDFFFLDPAEAYDEPNYISILSRVFVGAGQLLLGELQRIRYIGPIRVIPERGFTPVLSPDQGRWSDGSAAWDMLHKEKDKPKWLNTKQIADLDLRYRIEQYRNIEIPCESALGGAIEKIILGVGSEPFDVDAISAAEFSRLEIRSRLRIVADESEIEVAPADIGIGISQVLPIVIGAMAPGYSILSVEQPELHIHPAVQCRLADLLAHQTLGNDERMMLLETHSEHLILRLLRRVREMNEGNLEPGSPEIRPEDLSILYVTSLPEGLEITELPVTEDGDFDKPWPKGFFPERSKELY